MYVRGNEPQDVKSLRSSKSLFIYLFIYSSKLNNSNVGICGNIRQWKSRKLRVLQHCTKCVSVTVLLFYELNWEYYCSLNQKRFSFYERVRKRRLEKNVSSKYFIFTCNMQ